MLLKRPPLQNGPAAANIPRTSREYAANILIRGNYSRHIRGQPRICREYFTSYSRHIRGYVTFRGVFARSTQILKLFAAYSQQKLCKSLSIKTIRHIFAGRKQKILSLSNYSQHIRGKNIENFSFPNYSRHIRGKNIEIFSSWNYSQLFCSRLKKKSPSVLAICDILA